MSLSKLLAAGKSIMGVKDGNSPYRMKARNPLPKFVSNKNPCARPGTVPTSAQPRRPARETVSLFNHAAKDGATEVTRTTEPPKTAPGKIEAPGVEPRPVKPAPTPIPAQASAVRAEPADARRVVSAPQPTISGEPGALRKWARVVNPMTYLAGRNAEPTEAKTRETRPVVQGELSLENVTVMRNPLNDSDLEVVPAKPVIVREPAAMESPERDITLRGTTMRGETVTGAAVFTSVEAGVFGTAAMDMGNAR